MNFSNIAQDYQTACNNVHSAIKASPYKMDWIRKQLGFNDSPSAFYKRLKEGNWTPTQLAAIGYLLEGKAIAAN